jgi:hypothetical protein
MTDSGLTLARRDEAIAFFQVNQAGRTAVERVVALFFSVAAIAGSVGVAAHTPDVVLPLPPLLLLLLSYMFQQYGDLTVIGTARRHLEDLVNQAVEGKGLIYETAVAQVRQVPPLVHSMRLLQSLLGLIVLAAARWPSRAWTTNEWSGSPVTSTGPHGRRRGARSWSGRPSSG